MRVAARGQRAEAQLAARISKVWKTDLSLSDEARHRHVAATIKSNWHRLEGGPGLRLGIVPEAKDLPAGIRRRSDLWLAVLPDPNGFMGLFNDAYQGVAEAVFTLGKHDRVATSISPRRRDSDSRSNSKSTAMPKFSMSSTRSTRLPSRISSASRRGSFP